MMLVRASGIRYEFGSMGVIWTGSIMSLRRGERRFGCSFAVAVGTVPGVLARVTR